MNALRQLINDIDACRRQGRETFPTPPLPLKGRDGTPGWIDVVREARIALAALKRIKRVGRGPIATSWGNQSEEAEIADAALRRIAGKKPRRSS